MKFFSKNKIVGILIISLLLIVAFLWGGSYTEETSGVLPQQQASTALNEQKEIQSTNMPQISKPKAEGKSQEKQTKETTASEKIKKEYKEQNKEEKKNVEIKDKHPDKEENVQQVTEEKIEAEKTRELNQEVQTGRNKPVNPETIKRSSNEKPTCTLTVRCDTILSHMQDLDPAKVNLVPKDGIILAEEKVEFEQGESVFDVLQRTLKKKKIHMEFESTPAYHSVYINGINNLYEFDCGELSGWTYKVNGWFPNYGCSKYILKNGDKIEWLYTCDLGRDVGAYLEGGES